MGESFPNASVCPSTMTTPSTPAAARSYHIPLAHKATLDATLAKLAKRAEKKGLPALTWAWGKADTSNPSRVIVPMSFTGERPHYAGWAFVATLQHLDGENILRTIPGCVVHEDCRQLPALGRACAGSDLPAIYKTRGPVCDHCQAKRRRKDTYVLFHAATNKHVQVGSTCIADFLGSDEAEKMAAHAEVYALAASAAEGSENSGPGTGWAPGAYGEIPLTALLTCAAFSVRTYGWTSRATAREEGGRATADVAWAFALSEDARERADYVALVTDADAELAAAAEAWAENLSDAEVDAADGDYLHNLRAVARTGLVGGRTVGIAASMIVAYQRVVARATRAAEHATRPVCNVHLGTVGAKIALGTNGHKLPRGVERLDGEAVTLDFVTGYATEYGYTTVLKFKTAAGASVVWKATSTMLDRAAVGRRFAIVGTIKAHDEYKGEKQTVLTRCSVTEVSA